MKMTDAVAVLDALAQETRLEIFRFLIRAGTDGASAGRIGERLELHSATLSFHLNALKQAGLVSARRESRSIIYTASFARMRELLGYLTHDCCRGELAAPFEAILAPARARAA
jgi:DNA-binding transcriptional ArsR family regulator